MSELAPPFQQQKPLPVDSYLEHLCQLDLSSKYEFKRLCNIICTIGPKSRSIQAIEQLFKSGMNIARINLSHGTHKYHAETIKNIRTANKIHSKNIGYEFPLAIAVDTKGPEIRTGHINVDGATEMELTKNQTIKLTINNEFEQKGSPKMLWIDYENIVKIIKPKTRIFLDNGEITLMIEQVSGDTLTCTVEHGGILGSHKIVTFASDGIPIDLPAISENDKLDLKFCLDNNVDMIFFSYLKEIETLQMIKRLLGDKGKDIKLIAKIDNTKIIENIDLFVDSFDGFVIVSRYLSIKLTFDKLFLAQKLIIAKCNKEGKPIMCATQILESMIKHSRPTPLEISNIANTVIDGIDGFVLSQETSTGDYIQESVLTLAKICKESEAASYFANFFTELIKNIPMPLDAAQASAIATVQAANKCEAGAIIVITATGQSAHLLSKFRPNCPIIAVTRLPQTARQCLLYRGIFPVCFKDSSIHDQDDWLKGIDERLHFGLEFGRNCGIISTGVPVVIVSGSKQGAGFTNTMRIEYAIFDDIF